MSGWLFFLLVAIWSNTVVTQRRVEKAEERAEEAEQRRIEAENARILREQEEQYATWKMEEDAKEKAFWAKWNDPSLELLSWPLLFENGPEDFDDEYYDTFDECLGPEWRRYLGVPPKGGYPPVTAQFGAPWRAAS